MLLCCNLLIAAIVSHLHGVRGNARLPASACGSKVLFDLLRTNFRAKRGNSFAA
jgi:hypothetical protein